MVFGAGNSELEESVRGVALLQGREVRPDRQPELGRFYDSDQLSFALHGVPALYVKAGIDDAARGPEWGEAQLEDYRAHRYRQAADKYSEDWDLRGAVEDLELVSRGRRAAGGHAPLPALVSEQRVQRQSRASAAGGLSRAAAAPSER